MGKKITLSTCRPQDHQPGAVTAALMILILVLGCARVESTATPIAPPEPDTTIAEQPGLVPAFEPAACQFDAPSDYEIECGYLVVPEDRGQPEGPVIRLHIAVFKSKNPSPAPDPVIHLTAAGASLLDAVSTYLAAGGDRILETRDYVLFNPRGARYALPALDCPGQSELRRALASQGVNLAGRHEQIIAFLLDCQRELLDRGINLAAYNNAASAADVEDLRVALGYRQVNLYGISGGTRLALTMMRDQPEGLRAVILDSVYPPQVDLYSETPVNAARAFNLLFQDCAADPYCKQTYPDLEETLYRVIDKLNASPAQVTLSAGTVTVDGGHFLDLLFSALYHADAIPLIPMMISVADKGNLDAISSLFESLFKDVISEGAYYSTECRDEVPFQSRAEASALASDLPPQLSGFDFYAPSFVFKLCESWESGIAGAIEDQPVVSDIPALVLAGQYDPVTPPDWGRLAAETLGNGFFYEFRGIGHGAMRSNVCALEIGLQFLDVPTAEPDASCIDALSGPDFK